MGYLGSHLFARRQGRLSNAPVGQADRRDRSRRGGAVEEIRSARGPQYWLGDARAECRAQAERLRRRHGLVLLERCRREPARVPAEGGEPEMDRRDRVPAARAPLLGPARAGAAGEDDGADREVRARGCGSQELAIQVDLEMWKCGNLGMWKIGE